MLRWQERGDAMPNIDWRTPATYAHARNISTAGFAWEFLRRDPEYRRDFRRVKASPRGTVEAQAAFTDRWGLRFPGRPGPARRRGTAVLVACAAA
ncbi:hypothetical protein FHS97_000597 [Sphingomonas endophytica]|uniref:Transcriptional regulator-like domain-containing protein n=1 Tax=Sphingomonas endophytica TaxID=869719 RepID=A0ABR6N2C6_9SPHN|nr:hypothetical protein [Sphingomonas endophytica]